MSRKALLWQNNRVDHVDDPVAAKNVGLDDFGVVDHHRAIVNADGVQRRICWTVN